MKNNFKIPHSNFSFKHSVAVILVVAGVTAIASAACPLLTISADKKEMGKGETLKVTAEMSWKQSGNADDIIIAQVTPPSCSLLDLVDSKQTSSSHLTGDGVYARKIIEYYFTAREKGEGAIEPVVVEYFTSAGQEDKNIVKSETINIKVVSYLSSFTRKLLRTIVFAALILLIVGAIVFLKNRKNLSRKKAPGTESTVLEEDFLSNMRGIAKYIIEGDYGKYYTGATSAISNYLSEKYSISLPVNPGSMELDGVPAQLSALYFEWVSMEEKVRFSGYRPEKNEQEKLMRETERYFKSMVPDKNPEELIETVG